LLRRRDQAARGVGFELEALLQQQGHGAAFVVVEDAVSLGDVYEKRGGGKAQVPFAEIPVRGIRAGHFLQKLSQSFEHARRVRVVGGSFIPE
jgi:hypothetical protein